MLVALAWPHHVHHRAALSWFVIHRDEGWATCPLTESGFVRVSSNRRILSDATSPREAIALLRAMVALPGHVFWRDEVSFARGNDLAIPALVGHRQVTDAHLVALAIQHDGRIVTFDRGLRDLVPPPHDPATAVELIP